MKVAVLLVIKLYLKINSLMGVNKYTAVSLSAGILFLTGLAGCQGDSGNLPAGGEVILQTRRDVLIGDTPGKVAADTVCFAKGERSNVYSTVWKAEVRGGKTVLLERRYYPTDNSAVYLRGYSPVAAISNNLVGYEIDGRQDICLTSEQVGRLSDMFWQESKCFSFAHLLTQLRFRVQCDTEEILQLLSLQVEGGRTQAVLDLSTGNLSFDGKPESIEVCQGTLSFGFEPVPVPGAVMVEAGVPLLLTLKVVQAGGRSIVYEHLPVVFDETDKLSQAGTSYLLSVVLHRGGAISLSPLVGEWQRGANGIGNIEE